MYKKILKELNRGNCVLLDVRYKYRPKKYWDRFRLITPASCSYILHESEICDQDSFNESCFMRFIENIYFKNSADISNKAQEIVHTMRRYDESHNYHIIKVLVLK